MMSGVEQQGNHKPLPHTHRLARLLKRPNPRQSGGSFRAEIAMYRRLTGACLIWNVPNLWGDTVERYVLPRAAVTPMRPTLQFPEGSWKVQLDSSRYGIDGLWSFGPLGQFAGWEIDARQVQTMRDHHPIYKDDAQSPVSACALWTDTSAQIDISRHAHLVNGPDPSIGVVLPDDFDPPPNEMERIRADFEQKYAGTAKHGKVAFMTQGKEIVPLGSLIKDMQYNEGWEQMRDAILSIHGVPPIAVGIEQPTGREGLYAPLKQFELLTIQPMLSEMAEDDTEAIAKQHGDDYEVEYVAKSIEDPDRKDAEIRLCMDAGAIRVDEVRKEFGREPWGGDEGEKIVGGQSQQPMLDPQTGQPPASPSGQPPGVATPDQQFGVFGEASGNNSLEKMFAHKDGPDRGPPTNGQSGLKPQNRKPKMQGMKRPFKRF